MYDFKWIAWNREKIALHNVSVAEAKYVVRHPFRGYPRQTGGKRLTWGRTIDGAYLQVVYVIEPDDRIFVIHARPLTEIEKRRFWQERR